MPFLLLALISIMCSPSLARASAATAEAVSAPARTLSLTQALVLASRANEIEAIDQNVRAIELRFGASDLVLEPMLELNAKRNNENSETLSRTQGFKPRLDVLSAELSKPFSTGTELSLNASWENALTPLITPDHRDTVAWQVGISQSLWRDAFGRSTRLRRSRQESEYKRDLAAALRQRAEVLRQFEGLYWDWAVTLRSIELQAKNLKRSQEILQWVRDRFNRSAAEKSDLLHAQSLLTQRELRLATLRQSLTQAETAIARYSNEKWQPDSADLSRSRSPEGLVSHWPKSEISTETTLEYLEADASSQVEDFAAQEVRESLRPELNLEATYGKNAIDTDSGEAWQRSIDEHHEKSSIGVVLRTGLDLTLESKKKESALAASQSAKRIRDARATENAIAWSQLKRELGDLSEMTTRAKALVELQTKKADAERERYRKGRSTALQAISFEQDAAEAEITLLNLYATARKTEARARLFAQ